MISMPDASFLTNGTVGVRPLIKYGMGTLTIAGDATYTGGTTINGGTLVLGNGGSSGSVIGNIVFCAGVSDPSCDPLLAFNRSDVFSFGGSITGPGQVLQTGSGTTILSGQSSYSGPTTVNSGTLVVTGSITSPVTVNGGGILSGSGIVGGATIGPGGLLAPANPGGALTVQGNLFFATAATYLVEIANNGSDRINVTGNAALAGNVLVALTGSVVSKQYTIVNATGGIAGTFAGVNNLPSTFQGNLTYDPSNVFLNLSLNYNALGSLNSNQQNVANGLANFFSSNGSIPLTYATLTPAALSQIAGEASTGSQQTTFQAMSQFITMLLDPFIGGRADGSTPTPAPATPYAEEGASAYAAGGKTPVAERTLSLCHDVSQDAAARSLRSALERLGGELRRLADHRWQRCDRIEQRDQPHLRRRGSAPTICCRRAPLPASRSRAAAPISPSPMLGSGRSDLFQAGAFVRHTAGAGLCLGGAGLWLAGHHHRPHRDDCRLDKLHARVQRQRVLGPRRGRLSLRHAWIGVTPYAAGAVHHLRPAGLCRAGVRSGPTPLRWPMARRA